MNPPSAPARKPRSGWFQSLAGRSLAAIFALSLLTPVAEAKRYGGGGGKSFSSGSRSTGGGSSGGGYSSGRSSYSSGSSKSAPSASTSRSGYDSAAARARQQADSQSRYAGSKPPPIPATSSSSSTSGSNRGSSTFRGGAQPPPIPQGRGYASSSGGYSGGYSQPYRRGMSTGTKAALIGAAVLAPALLVYASRPAVHYQDSYGSPFWWWLLDQPQDVRASWLYHHQGSIDSARRAELLRADPGLQAKVDELSSKNVPVEPNYAPPGLKPDDMFTDPAAEAEAQAAAEEAENQTRGSSHSPGGSSGLFWLTALGGGAAAAWLLFFKRWQPAAA